MEADPFSGDITRLQPTGWRRRVGNYRIFYDLDIEERLIVITWAPCNTMDGSAEGDCKEAVLVLLGGGHGDQGSTESFKAP